jgi:hypothetical protein
MKIDSNGNFLWGQDLFFYGIGVSESDDGRYMVLGDGPIVVTKGSVVANPQIGLIKTDLLGNSSDCVYPVNFESINLTVDMQEISITSTADGGTISNFYPLITDATLLVYNGCVDVVGGFEENQLKTPEISAFPNPSAGLFQIYLNDLETTSFRNLEIYNMLGEKVYESKNPAIIQSSIDLRSQPDGIYYIQCVFEKTSVSGHCIIHH